MAALWIGGLESHREGGRIVSDRKLFSNVPWLDSVKQDVWFTDIHFGRSVEVIVAV